MFRSCFETADTAASVLATFARFGHGINSRPAARKPEQLLKLYEFEGCPYCRLVREALTELDLDAMILPCPKGGGRFRPDAIAQGGKAQFPFLVDPNTGRQLYESAEIIAYLFETYAGRSLPLSWRFRPGSIASSMVATALRPLTGTRARPSKAPEQPLKLYSFESSPFARRVRETLSELELPYHLHNLGRTRASDYIPPIVRERLHLKTTVSGENREAFVARTGRMMVPYLIDPNTGTEMFESANIRRYLEQTYAA